MFYFTCDRYEKRSGWWLRDVTSTRVATKSCFSTYHPADIRDMLTYLRDNNSGGRATRQQASNELFQSDNESIHITHVALRLTYRSHSACQ